MSNKSLVLLLLSVLTLLLIAAALQIAEDGAYAGLTIGITLVPMAMLTSALISIACGLRSHPSKRKSKD